MPWRMEYCLARFPSIPKARAKGRFRVGPETAHELFSGPAREGSPRGRRGAFLGVSNLSNRFKKEEQESALWHKWTPW